jgi:hypothetical protein
VSGDREEYEDEAEDDEDKAWFLLVESEADDREQVRFSLTARCIPVIGEGERRSMLAEVECFLLRVAQRHLRERNETLDDDDDDGEREREMAWSFPSL